MKFIVCLFLKDNTPQSASVADLQSRRHKAKVSFLFLIPLLFFIVASSVHIVRLSQHAQQHARLNSLTNQTIALTELLHELQKERGISGIFLSSTGKKFSSNLKKQWQATDHKLMFAQRLSGELDKTPRNIEISNGLLLLNEELKKLASLRQQIEHFNIDIKYSLKSYNLINATLLEIISKMAKEVVGVDLERRFLAYVSFINEKERVGIERAVLGTAFTLDYLSAENYQYFVQLETEQNLFRQQFLSLASEHFIRQYHVMSHSTSHEKVQAYRDLVHRKVNKLSLGVDSAKWFDIISNKINQFQKLEQKIAQELLAKSQRSKTDSETEKWLWISAVFFITLFCVIGALVLIRNINGAFSRRLNEYSTLFENSAEGMVVIDPVDQSIILSNDQFSAITGYTRPQISKLKFFDFFMLEGRKHTALLFDPKGSSEIQFIEELELVRGDDEIVYVELSTFPILIRNKNYIAVNTKDIGERLKAELNFKKSQQATKVVLDSLNCAVNLTDIETNKSVFLNKMASEIYRDKEQVEPVWSLLSPPSLSLDQPMYSNFDSELCEQVFNKSRKRWYQVTSKSIKWHDKKTFNLRVLEDITERYDTEQKNKNLLVEIRQLSLRNYSLQEKERKQLAAELHDELGQLMTGIMLQADYIHRVVEGHSPHIEAPVQSIIQTTKTLMTSVQRITNELRPVLLDHLGLSEALSELVLQWQQVNRSIFYQFIAEDSFEQISDQICINAYRIIQECLTNISKHSKATMVTVSLKLEEAPTHADCTSLVLHISDNGVGFNKDKAHFNGMGLINMRERVEALGGTFRLLNKPGKGVDTLAYIPV